MKKIIILLAFISSSFAQAQVVIGKNTATNESVSLEFSESENKGLVLPYVEDKKAISVDGTLIFDTMDNKVKYLKNGSWFDLSIDETGAADLTIQSGIKEQEGVKVAAIGEPSDVEGVLVLEDNNKAMILPKVESPHLNIINPSAGMIVYDTKARQLAVYNGTVWSFWKPREE